MAGAGASLALFAPSIVSAQGATRRFDVYRGSSKIGSHNVSAEKSGDQLLISIDIDIEVRVLGFRAYYYKHANREVWSGGRIASFQSRTDDDGDTFSAKGETRDGALVINGTKTRAKAPTSYWNVRNFEARPWYSTQSGKTMALTFAKGRRGALTEWRVGGDFSITLLYDAAGEWRGSEFPAQGETARYRQVAAGPNFATLLR